jgi:hypothetical protein
MSPFPTTPLLDDFNRANENPLSDGGNWSGSTGFSSFSSAQLVSNAINPVAPSTYSGNYWAASQFGPDCEVFADVEQSSASDTLYLYCRVPVPTSNTLTGYLLRYFNGVVSVSKSVLGAQTQINSNTITLAAGDSIGLSVRGSIETAYWRKSGVWSSGTPVSDSAVTGSGYIAFAVWSSGSLRVEMDNFGGGTTIPKDSFSIVGEFDLAAF